ncbi:MAG: hypothetical protein J0H98_04030 [Solirubrobacterales bacterium]|nr:hypothetical protein [Solirubrobacterales bacterium]
METTVADGKYRFRTRLRGALPYRLLWLSPKGKDDCDGHEWYRSDGDTWRCYHCEVGVSEGSPLSSAEQMEATVGALRLTSQLPPTAETEATIARLVEELDRSVHPLAEELEADPASISRIQAALHH